MLQVNLRSKIDRLTIKAGNHPHPNADPSCRRVPDRQPHPKPQHLNSGRLALAKDSRGELTATAVRLELSQNKHHLQGTVSVPGNQNYTRSNKAHGWQCG